MLAHVSKRTNQRRLIYQCMFPSFGNTFLKENKEKWQYITEDTHADTHMNTHVSCTHSDLTHCASLPCKALC